MSIKRKKLTHDTFRINLENLLSDRREIQCPYIVGVRLYEVSREANPQQQRVDAWLSALRGDGGIRR